MYHRGMSTLLRLLFLLAAGIATVREAQARVGIPPHASLALDRRHHPTLNGASNNVRPTPLLVSGSSFVGDGSWFCTDPLQTIHYGGSGEPTGNGLVYASTNPVNFDKRGAAAPGLPAARIQNLADPIIAASQPRWHSCRIRSASRRCSRFRSPGRGRSASRARSSL
jgi:hypothetical protein